MKTTNFTRIGLCLALLIVQFASPSSVSACSCIQPGSPIEVFRGSGAVFIGKVTSISPNSSLAISLLVRMFDAINLHPTYLYTERFWGYDVTFAVHKSWKNVSTTSVTVHTGSGGGDCGYPFNQGDDYLVYAYEWKDSLGTGSCSRTTEISGATEDLSYLNTIPTLALTPVYSYSWLIFTGASVLGFIVLLGLVIALRKRQRQSGPTGEQQ